MSRQIRSVLSAAIRVVRCREQYRARSLRARNSPQRIGHQRDGLAAIDPVGPRSSPTREAVDHLPLRTGGDSVGQVDPIGLAGIGSHLSHRLPHPLITFPVAP
jgi:hypothetical protein